MDLRLLLIHCMRAVYRAQGLEEWTTADVIGCERLPQWPGVTAHLRHMPAAREPPEAEYGPAPWLVYEAVVLLLGDFLLNRAIELSPQATGVQHGSVSVRYTRPEPEGGDWHGLVRPDDVQVVQSCCRQRSSTQRGILVGVTATDGTFLQGMRAHGAAGLCIAT